MKLQSFFPSLVAGLFLFAPMTRAQLVTGTLDIPSFAAGSYDAFGASDTRAQGGGAGFAALQHVRGPSHSYVAFHIPPFVGTVTNAMLIGSAYMSSSNAVELLRFYSVTSSVASVLEGGLNRTNIYQDLGSGVSYGTNSFGLGYNYVNYTLNANATGAIQSARGGDFLIGGSLFNPSTPPNYNEFVSFPDFQPYGAILRLQISTPAAPTIYTQPPAHSYPSNDYPSQLTVGALGAPPLAYHWFLNGIEQDLRFGPYFYISGLSTNPVSVFVVVSNQYGQATSSVAQVSMPPATFRPVFTNLTVHVGETVTLQPEPQPYQPSLLEWRKDGVVFSTDQNFQQTLTNLQTGDSGDYTLTISNGYGVITSPVITLRVQETPPTFIQEPFNQTAALGSTVYLGSTAVAGPPPSYRWYLNDAPVISLASENPLAGGTNATLAIPDISISQTGRYFVVASNAFGITTSGVSTVTTYLDPPVFTSHPASVTVYPGNTASLYVTVLGQPYPQLRWYHDGVAIPGDATSSSYYLYNVSSNSAGAYFCVASNASGVVTSQTATVTVPYVPPVLNVPFTEATVGAGSDFYFYVTVLNPPAFVQLQSNGSVVPPTFFTNYPGYYSVIFPSMQPAQSGPYRVVASNDYGMVTSAVISLTVTTSPPTFVRSPTNQTVLEGGIATLSFYVSSAPPADAVLYHDGVATSVRDAVSYVWLDPGLLRVFTLPRVTPADSGSYFVVASNRYGMATSEVAHVLVQRAGPLDKWIVRNPIPQGRDLHGVAWGLNKFVAVGDNGAVVTSVDGTNWTARNAYTEEGLAAVTFGGGRFVAVGGAGSVLVSTNGETWDAHGVNTNANLIDVAFGNGQYLAIGWLGESYGAIQSTNGVDWTPCSIPFACSGCSFNQFLGVTFGNGNFMVIDYYASTYVSPDLLAWTTGNSLLPTSVLGATFVNGKFIALGYGGYFNDSVDGTNWGASYYNGVANRNYRGISFGAGRYVAVGSKGKIITSSGNLQTWSSVISPTPDRLDDLVFANNIFVAVGEHGTILTSSDGLSWSNRTSGFAFDLDGLAVGDGLAVAVGKGGTILTSSDGTSWSYTLAAGVPDGLHGIAYGNGKWVAVGEGSNIVISVNGRDWGSLWPGFPIYSMKSVLYASNLWIAVGVQGQIITSSDATNWTLRSSPVTHDLNEVTYGNGRFVIVGDNNLNPNATILASPNGINWGNYSLTGPGKNARGITFANGLYVIALNDGEILYDTNALPGNWFPSWQYGSSGVTRNLRGLTWTNNLWIAVGNNGAIITSTNAQTWRPRISPTFENLHAVRFFNNTFLAVGNEGVILQTPPLSPQLFAAREGTNIHLTFSTPHEGVSKLQHTEDFDWHDLALITNVVGTVEVDIPLPSGPAKHFYRVVAP